MATSDLVQYLSAKSTDIAASDRRVTETFIAHGTIGIGDFVSFQVADGDVMGADRCLKVQRTDSDGAGSKTGIGVCVAVEGVTSGVSAAAGDRVTVVVKGYVEGANVADGTTAGACLVPGSDAGRAVAAGANDEVPLVAQLLETPSSNTADVWVIGVFS